MRGARGSLLPGRGDPAELSATRLQLALVVAMARNGVIGRGNGLPWHLPEDLRHFKALTLGKPILMGRRTYETIGRPLPGRDNLVLTREREWRAEGVSTVHSLDEALERAQRASELMVIGGAEVYRLTLPLAQRIYLTEVLVDVEGDTLFPDWERRDWRELHSSVYPADARNAYGMRFVTLAREA
jgi:dihydrofolate reductase